VLDISGHALCSEELEDVGIQGMGENTIGGAKEPADRFHPLHHHWGTIVEARCFVVPDRIVVHIQEEDQSSDQPGIVLGKVSSIVDSFLRTSFPSDSINILTPAPSSVERDKTTYLENTGAHSPKEVAFSTDNVFVNSPSISLAFNGEIYSVARFQEAQAPEKRPRREGCRHQSSREAGGNCNPW
jgi:hypothetical protein